MQKDNQKILEVEQLQHLKQVVSSESYDHIHLTDEEKEIWSEWAFRIARRNKSGILNEIAYAKRLREDNGYLQLNYEQLHSVMLKKAEEKGLIIDEWNREIFETLCLYFSNDPSFEMQGDNFTPLKGIMLRGNIGCGKTTLLELFKDNPFKPFGLVACRDVAKDYQIEVGIVIGKYSNLRRVHAKMYHGHESIGLCFDDLGTEDDKKNFGNNSNVMLDVLLDIYDKRSFGCFFLTTNLSADDIEKFYGPRLRSRLREMFNVLDYHEDAPDRRK